MDRFEEYERYLNSKLELCLERLVEELTSICSERGYCYELQYSEVENLYYGMITDYSASPQLIHECKKSSSMKRCVIKLLYELVYKS